MKTRLPFLLLSVVLAATLAACGGGGSTQVPADAVAQVGSVPISKATFNTVMNVACARYKSQGQPCPKVGTPTYSSLRDSAINFLVQQEELTQEAKKKLGVTVTQKDLAKQVEQIKKAYYHGDTKKFDQAVKQQGMTLAQLEQIELLPNLLGQKVKAKLTPTVTTAAALKFYNTNKATFTTPKTREVRHILVNSKSLAEKIRAKLVNGANFAALAKKYSKDPGSADKGGKYCVAHGTRTATCITTVPPFDKAAFSLKTNEISQPVHSVDGWHVIQPISAITPAHAQTFKEVEASIKANLASQNQQTALNAFLAKMAKDFKVAYQSGYAPATTTTPTTTTG
jgi:parvulin-like peptidyl-prolyl isomerase